MLAVLTPTPAHPHPRPTPPLLPRRFVDDTNVYRVTIHKTFEGNLVRGWGWCGLVWG